MKQCEQYEARINEVLAGVEAQKAECRTKIDKADADMNKAESDMNEALRSGDDVAYISAKEERDRAEASLNVATARLNTFTRGPLISKEEYESMVSGILSKMGEANDRDKREAVKLCEKLIAITDRNLSMIEEGNALLHRLQYDVYRGADIPRNKNTGEFVLDFSGRLSKQFIDKNSLFGWAYYALKNCVQYTALRDSVIEKP